MMGDHPRRCGAFVYARLYQSAPSGSSPQVRGISDLASFLAARAGIIPAGAGHF